MADFAVVGGIFIASSVGLGAAGTPPTVDQLVQITTQKLLTGLHADGPHPNFTGLEIILAGQMDAKIESRFGHLLLRFVGTGDPYEDVVVEFVAQVKDADVNAIRGLTGSYLVSVNASQVQDLIDGYAINERRSLTRFVVPSSIQQRSQLLNLIRKYASHSGADGRYFYEWRNCASLLLNAIHKAGLGVEGEEITEKVPLFVGSYLKASMLSPYPGISLIDPPRLYHAIRQVVARDPEAAARRPQDILNQLSTLDLTRFYLLNDEILSDSLKSQIIGVLHLRSDRPTTFQVFNATPVAKEYYEASSTGLSRVNPNQYWSETTIRKSCSSAAAYLPTVPKTFFPTIKDQVSTFTAAYKNLCR